MSYKKNTSKICIFTIVSNNYLHYANTLFESVKKHCPEADLVLGLCDEKQKDTFCPDADDIIELKNLEVTGLGHFVYQYTILELNTAIKPYVIEMLMNRGYEKVIYLDPDIKIFDTLSPMLSLLDKFNVLLTPHLTDVLDDGKLPNELGILQAGSYNLGYIGLKTNDETRKLVKWWQSKLFKECVVDISRGLFVDQKWMDMVPSIFSGVYINRDEGWNVAYWNLNHRDVIKLDTGQFEVNGRPLMFFHYSGYSIEARTLSKHQNRFDKNSKGPALVELCDIYNECLTNNGIGKYKHIPYKYNQFSDGVRVPETARKLIRENEDLKKINFFDKEAVNQIHDYLNTSKTQSEKSPILVTNLTEALWNSRDDLKQAFPDLYGIDGVGYAEWLLCAAEKEASFDFCYLQAIKDSLEKYRTINNTNDEYIQLSSLMSGLIKYIWKKKEKIPLPIRLALGKNVATWAFRSAYQGKKIPKVQSLGVNLIGYMQAESGVGEAARASLRGLEQSEIAFSVIDYRLGNISRMEEKISYEYDESATHSVNLIHVNADQSKIAKDHLGDAITSNCYNIGYWYWEMSEFPSAFDFAFEQVDEVWVSSEYNYAAISARTTKPVTLIPPNIALKSTSLMSREELGFNDDDFIFFHMSDVLSMHQRKNPLGVVKAFNQAFADFPEQKVKLIIKISNLDKQPQLEKEILSIIDSEPRIELISGYMDRDTLNNFLKNIDSYVSLHRAEGFGLPIAEAMSLGKVVIATMWSGNVDFMNEDNSLPVSYELVKLKEQIGPYEKDQLWAEPNLTDASDKMFCLANDVDLQTKLGEKAKETILLNYSPNITGIAISNRIKQISEII
jgi:glycosyltransferase involved in cell wall biosynthesis